eukprot:scaffold46474_cov69-Phaeocystis_antarctica.AAC.2
MGGGGQAPETTVRSIMWTRVVAGKASVRRPRDQTAVSYADLVRGSCSVGNQAWKERWRCNHSSCPSRSALNVSQLASRPASSAALIARCTPCTGTTVWHSPSWARGSHEGGVDAPAR